ncbi:MAG TPA: hypothetical protein VGI21_07280 [Streptosporangiaceae bacterium]
MLTMAAVAACAGPSRPAPNPAPGLVLSNYERATGDTVPRDCGYSSPLPGQSGWSLWLFCDTAVTSDQGTRIDRLILGTDTAAAGPYRAGQAPTRLSEIPTPPAAAARPSDGAPEPFLPAPQGLVRPGGTASCSGAGAYPAAWITGVAREPARSDLLISYNDYCVTGGARRDWAGALGTDVPGSLTPEGSGLVEYDPASNQLGSPEQVFGSPLGLALPVQQVLGSPVFDGGHLYQFGFCSAGTLPSGCPGGKVFMVRVQATPAAWRNPLSYQYWTGSGWSLDPNTAASVLPAGHPLGVSAGDYRTAGHGLVLVEQTSLGGDFQVWQASAPAGPWRKVAGGRVPCRAAKASGSGRGQAAPGAGQGAGQGAGDLCRAIIGHPELSTRSRLLVSYFNPGNDHVDTSSVAW